MKTRRTLINIALVIGLCGGVVVSRAVWDGNAALGAAAKAHDKGDVLEAIRWYRRAARWYVPAAPHVARAYEQLEAIAKAADEAGDAPVALAAWRAIRGSILATRSFFTPQEHRLEPANRRIASWMARTESTPPTGAAPRIERESWHYELLAQDHAPSVGWSVIALLGFAMWIGGGFWFAWRGVDDQDHLVNRVAASAGILVAIGLVVWMLGLYKA